jgi:hypothetical protein
LKHKKNTSTTWLISYILVLVLPIIINFFAYVQVENILLEQINEYNKQILINKHQAIDNIAEKAITIAEKTSVLKEVEVMSKYALPLNANEYYDISKFMNYWKYSNDLTNIKDMYIYLPKSDYIVGISTNNIPKSFYLASYSGNAEEYNNWYSVIKNAKKGEYTTYSYGGNRSLLYVYSGVLSLLYKDAPIIIVEIEKDKFINPTSDISIGKLCVIDEKNRVVLSEFDSKMEQRITEINWGKNGEYISLKDNNKNLIASSIVSKNTKWRYIYLTNSADYMNKIILSRFIMIFGISLCIILGILLIYLSIKRNNKPIKELVKRLTFGEEKIEDSIDDYQYIDKIVMKAITEKETYASIVYTQKKGLRDSVLSKLLNSQTENWQDLELQLNSFDIKFEYSNYLVMLFYIVSVEELFFEKGEETAERYRQAQFIMINIIEEMLRKKFNAYVFSTELLLSCIVNYETHSEEVRNEILEIIKEAREFIVTNFNLEFIVAVSNVKYSLDGLTLARQEAMDIMEHKFVRYNEPILEQKDTSIVNTNSYYYPLEKEHNLMNCLKIGDYDNSYSILNEILDINFNQKYLSL